MLSISQANGHRDPEPTTNAGGANRDRALAACLKGAPDLETFFKSLDHFFLLSLNICHHVSTIFGYKSLDLSVLPSKNS